MEKAFSWDCIFKGSGSAESCANPENKTAAIVHLILLQFTVTWSIKRWFALDVNENPFCEVHRVVWVVLVDRCRNSTFENTKECYVTPKTLRVISDQGCWNSTWTLFWSWDAQMWWHLPKVTRLIDRFPMSDSLQSFFKIQLNTWTFSENYIDGQRKTLKWFLSLV